jgi:MoaA/NifB/PqqE/SkfB family radical SAM enzyme
MPELMETETATRPYLFLDLGFYAACNLKCTYCRNEIVKDDGAFALRDLVAQVELFRGRFRAGVVKMSGYGEVTMWRDFQPALDYLSPLFPSVQVITNGTFSDRSLQALLAHGNISPNITLDGHLLAMNRLRVGDSERQHARILDNVAALLDGGRAVELNCVLHEHNADGFPAFCDHLHRLDGGRQLLMLFPFPVKSFDRARSAALPLRAGLRRLAERIPELWAEHEEILPAPSYGAELRSVLERGRRFGSCHVHWANLGSGSRNERLHCPNYGEDLSYGPMLESLGARADAIALEEADHLRAGHVGPDCAGCYNHFHIINHYLEGAMSLAELCRAPSLRPPGVAEIAAAVKDTFERARRAGVRAASLVATP